jgi:hypothetical protein
MSGKRKKEEEKDEEKKRTREERRGAVAESWRGMWWMRRAVGGCDMLFVLLHICTLFFLSY